MLPLPCTMTPKYCTNVTIANETDQNGILNFHVKKRNKINKENIRAMDTKYACYGRIKLTHQNIFVPIPCMPVEGPPFQQ